MQILKNHWVFESQIAEGFLGVVRGQPLHIDKIENVCFALVFVAKTMLQ